MVYREGGKSFLDIFTLAAGFNQTLNKQIPTGTLTRYILVHADSKKTLLLQALEI